MPSFEESCGGPDCANGPQELLGHADGGAGKENKKQLDMFNSVVVNYNSIAWVYYS
jgi:hypothetical protein